MKKAWRHSIKWHFSDVADDALYQLALIREQVGDGKLMLGGIRRIETVREELDRLSDPETGLGGGVIIGFLQSFAAKAKGDALFDAAKESAIVQYVLALDYLSTLSQRHPDSDRLRDTAIAFARIEAKINTLVPEKVKKEVKYIK